MVLGITSHAARLLPFAVPKAKTETKFAEMDDAVLLEVTQDGKYRMRGGEPMGPDALAAEIDALPRGSNLLVSPHPKARYGALVQAVDKLIERPGLHVAFGHPGRGGDGKGGPAPTTAPAGAK